MLLALSTTMPSAGDLGCLLHTHTHPERAQSFEVAVGTAHPVWPGAGRATVALLPEVDPVALVRVGSKVGTDGLSLAQYDNDRPYAASCVLAACRRRWHPARRRRTETCSRLRPAGHQDRGSEYLRISYGPDDAEPRHLDRLRQRGLGHKRSRAAREYALGIEALERVAHGEPLWRVHEPVFAVLALESEPVDSRW